MKYRKTCCQMVRTKHAVAAAVKIAFIFTIILSVTRRVKVKARKWFPESSLSDSRSPPTCSNPESQPCPGRTSKSCRGDIGMVWSLGIARGPDPFNVIYRGPIQTGQDALDFGDRVLFIADPFLFIHEKRWFIFTEALNNDCQKGEIAYHLSIDSGSTWSYGGIILKEDWHLSFPFVVSHEDAFYMITCATAGTQSPYSLWLYSTNSLPNGWKRVSKILQNQTSS